MGFAQHLRRMDVVKSSIRAFVSPAEGVPDSMPISQNSCDLYARGPPFGASARNWGDSQMPSDAMRRSKVRRGDRAAKLDDEAALRSAADLVQMLREAGYACELVLWIPAVRFNQ